MGCRPVDASYAAFVMPAVGILAVANLDARVQETAADGPEEGGETARLLQLSVVSLSWE